MTSAATPATNRDILSDINKTVSIAADVSGQVTDAAANTETLTTSDSVVPAPKSADAAAVTPEAALPSSVVVFSLGSTNIRYGFADVSVPNVKANVVAFETNEKTQIPIAESNDAFPAADDVDSAGAAQIRQFTADYKRLRRAPPPKPKFFDEYDSVAVYERDTPTTSLTLAAQFDPAWTDTHASRDTDDKRPRYFTGDEAVSIKPETNFRVDYPIRRGAFNVGATVSPWSTAETTVEGFPLSFKQCSDDLELILYDIITARLNIRRNQFKHLSIGVAVPDTFNPREMSQICHILLGRFHVKEVFLLQAAVSECFASGVATGISLHIGGQTTRITCVSDGNILPLHSINLQYGSDDVTALLLRLIKNANVHDHYLPYPHVRLHPQVPMQWKQLTAAKEKVCHYVLGNEFSYQWMELREYRDGLPTIQHRMNVSIAAVIAPMLYYYPNMIPRHNTAINYRQFAHSVLGTDYLTDEFMRQSLFYSYTAEYAVLEEKPSWPPPPPHYTNAGSKAAAAAVAAAAAAAVALAAESSKQADADVGGAGGSGSGNNRKKRGRPIAKTASTSSPVSPPSPSPANSPPPLQSPTPSPSPPPSSSVAAANGNSAETMDDADSNDDARHTSFDEPRIAVERQNKRRALMTEAELYDRTHRSLTDAIATVLTNTPPQLRARLLRHIVVSGSGSLIPGFIETLESELASVIPELRDPERRDGVRILHSPKAVEVGDLAWKGVALIVSNKEEVGLREMWITRDEWRRKGLTCIKTRVPFLY